MWSGGPLLPNSRVDLFDIGDHEEEEEEGQDEDEFYFDDFSESGGEWWFDNYHLEAMRGWGAATQKRFWLAISINQFINELSGLYVLTIP